MLLALPTYHMSCFKFPKQIINQLRNHILGFWRNQLPAQSKKLSWDSWEILCKWKHEGGLGFINLTSFNQAMLAKIGWKLLIKPNSLSALTLKSKYFLTNSFLEAMKGVNSSYIWSNLLWGRDLLVKWLGRVVSVYHNFPIWESNCIPSSSTFKPLINRSHLFPHLSLFDRRLGTWTKAKVGEIFHYLDVDRILSISIATNRGGTTLKWFLAQLLSNQYMVLHHP